MILLYAPRRNLKSCFLEKGGWPILQIKGAKANFNILTRLKLYQYLKNQETYSKCKTDCVQFQEAHIFAKQNEDYEIGVCEELKSFINEVPSIQKHNWNKNEYKSSWLGFTKSCLSALLGAIWVSQGPVRAKLLELPEATLWLRVVLQLIWFFFFSELHFVLQISQPLY